MSDDEKRRTCGVCGHSPCKPLAFGGVACLACERVRPSAWKVSWLHGPTGDEMRKSLERLRGAES